MLADVELPRTLYAVAPRGAQIAYQVLGEGNTDIVLTTNHVSCIDLMWDEPRVERFLRRLAYLRPAHLVRQTRDRSLGQTRTAR